MWIAIQRAEGGVSIMQIVTERDGAKIEIDVEAEIAKWAAVHPGEYVSHHEINPEDIPADRTFRGAWCYSGGKIDHNMDKARRIHRDRIRAARAPKLAALDIEYQRADERGDAASKREIGQRKQALRDAPADPRIDAAQTVEELKAIWPEVLAQ